MRATPPRGGAIGNAMHRAPGTARAPPEVGGATGRPRAAQVVTPFTETAMLHHVRTSNDAPKRAAVAPKPASGERFGTLINLSGRRRFTSQRVVLYAVLAAQGRGAAIATAQDALATFRDAHRALLEGELSPQVLGGELKLAHFGPDRADERITAFIALAQRTLDAIAADARGVPELLEALVESATPLLATLNRLTQIYEDLARTQAAAAKKQLTSVIGDIEQIAKHARIVSFNAQVVAARAGNSGREFAVVSGEFTQITGKLDGLVREAVKSAVA